MSLYFFQSFLILFIIFEISNLLNNKFKINNHLKYLFSILILLTTIFFSLKLIHIINFNFNSNLSYLFFIRIFFYILLFLTLYSFIKKKKYAFNKIDLYFVGIYFFLCFLTYDRYFLDEDEFTYWGLRIKDFYYLNEFQTFKLNNYHQPLLTFWQLFFSTNFEFKENIFIFANSVILIGAFFFLAEDILNINKINYKLVSLYLILYYLLINNLSFGFVSIYADPIIAILSACILKLIIKNEYHKSNILLLILLSICLYFVHRLGIIFLLLLLPLILLKNYKFIIFENKIRLLAYIILIIISIRFLFFNTLVYSQTPFNIFDRLDLLFEILIDFIINVKKIFLIDIYFSSFGTSINKFFEFYLNKKNILNIYTLNILFWVIILSIVIFFQKKKNILIYFILSLIFYFLVIYIEKIHFQNLSYLVFGRYVSIFLLSYMLYFFTKKNNIYLIYFLLTINFLITPLKSFGFFVPDSIYYAYEKNKSFKINREQIKQFSLRHKDCKNVFAIYNKKNFPNYLDGHYSLILNVINYELLLSRIRFQDLDELKEMKNTDFLHFYDCIFSINIANKDLNIFNFKAKKPFKINL